jgi:hypothetical protein
VLDPAVKVVLPGQYVVKLVTTSVTVVAPEGTDEDATMDVGAEVAALETAAEEELEGLHVPAEALFNKVSLSPSVPSEPWI